MDFLLVQFYFTMSQKNLVQPPHEIGLVVRGFFSFPQSYFENFISDDLNTLADGPRKGKATPEDAPRPPVGRQQEK